MFPPSRMFFLWHTILHLTPVSPNTEDDCTVAIFCRFYIFSEFLLEIDSRETGCCSVTHRLDATLVARVTNMDVSLKRQIRSSLRSMKNSSLCLWKKVKTNLWGQINHSVCEFIFDMTRRGKKEFNTRCKAWDGVGGWKINHPLLFFFLSTILWPEDLVYPS